MEFVSYTHAKNHLMVALEAHTPQLFNASIGLLFLALYKAQNGLSLKSQQMAPPYLSLRNPTYRRRAVVKKGQEISRPDYGTIDTRKKSFDGVIRSAHTSTVQRQHELIFFDFLRL